jgi:hypothetical protein
MGRRRTNATDQQAHRRIGDMQARLSYGEIYTDASVVHTADSVVVTNGTIDAGDVTSTREIDGVYLEVSESGKFEIAFTFIGLTGNPARCSFRGRYDGNPAHNVFLEIYDYVGVAWDRVTAAAQDFPDSSTDYSIDFLLPRAAKYLSGGEAQLRLRHDSTAVGSHDMFTDYICVVEAGLDMPTAGTEYLITGFTDGLSSGVTVDGAAGSMTVSAAGTYAVEAAGSFEGVADGTYTLAVYIDGAKERELLRRKIGASGDVGSAFGAAVLSLAAGEVLTFKSMCDTADAYVSVCSASFRVSGIGIA